ncbi:hypothetical protein [Ramlibacter albus]|uniref:Uncharacterized protein n=1 Tax=Ramlibacter albus TaxID=2079448 RepID=A0A923MF84_9BURK|nr:hypothetical protein [Ramlibacter albus]MBC5768179.1 hypothetical protein [Ramlibacter albus]
MKKKMTMWAPVAGWFAVAAVAVGFAFAMPRHAEGIGKVPPLAAKRLDQQQVQLPQQLPASRTLALVVFSKEQRAEVQSWIDGLRLQQGGIAWLKMPILSDPGDAARRTEIEQRYMARHASTADRTRLVPVFTDRDAFIRAVGLSGAEHASVLVLDRAGNVLARVEGAFDEDKAQALRETVLAQGD